MPDACCFGQTFKMMLNHMERCHIHNKCCEWLIICKTNKVVAICMLDTTELDWLQKLVYGRCSSNDYFTRYIDNKQKESGPFQRRAMTNVRMRSWMKGDADVWPFGSWQPPPLSESEAAAAVCSNTMSRRGREGGKSVLKRGLLCNPSQGPFAIFVPGSARHGWVFSLVTCSHQ